MADLVDELDAEADAERVQALVHATGDRRPTGRAAEAVASFDGPTVAVVEDRGDAVDRPPADADAVVVDDGERATERFVDAVGDADEVVVRGEHAVGRFASALATARPATRVRAEPPLGAGASPADEDAVVDVDGSVVYPAGRGETAGTEPER